MSGATLEQLNALSKPVPPQHIRKDDRGNHHTTARFVMNRLDSTVGKQNWRDEYRVVLIGELVAVECTLYIFIDGEWAGKSDVGTDEKYSPEKSYYSNALKRAAFKWGIARELYGEGNYYVVPAPENDFEDQPEQPDDAPAQPDAPQAASELGGYFGPDAPAPAPYTTTKESLFASTKTFDRANWDALMPHFIAAGLSGNTFEANGRLKKVLAEIAQHGATPQTVGEVALAFQARIDAKTDGK